MPTATIRIPAKSTQISGGHLGYGVDILASISLGTLADALGRMEHDDTDPGERPMNADQCRDALLREILNGWKLEDLVDVRIPVMNEAVGEIIGLRRRLDAADRELDKFRPLEFLLKRDGTHAMDQAVEKIREQADEIATLRRERDEVCVWGIIEDGRDEDRSWATGCGEEMIIIEGTPLENDYRFCPCCGRKLQIDTTPTPGAQA